MKRATRGYGLLENFLSRQRIKIATRLIGDNRRKGRILDIGCGEYPLFLKKIDFKEKFGIDKIITSNKNFKNQKLNLINWDIEKKKCLPFNNKYFDAITMLAVFEHLESDKLIPILKEIKRVLKINGSFIITTPVAWTDKILKYMARLKLISHQEVGEHKNFYNPKIVHHILLKSGFKKDRIKMGYFEMGMNIWIKVKK